MKKKIHSWSLLSVLGILVLVLFGIICIAPFIYMIIMSFTKSTTLMIHMKEIHFTDFSNCISEERLFSLITEQCDCSWLLMPVELYYFVYGSLWV